MPTADPLLRYQIMEPLGRGGQGHTFRAVDRDSGRDVAVKVVSLRKLDGWKVFDLFEREVAVLKGLRHPGIPAFIDSYSSEKSGDFFLVMELVDGMPLSETVAGRRPLKPDQLRNLFEQGLDILAYLHGLTPPVIHRDIKPANFVLEPSGRLRLVDFGGVRRAIEPDGGSTMIGTFGYMAPEQLHGECTPSSDIYSFGATIAAVVAGLDADKLPRHGLRIDAEVIDPPAWLRPVLPTMLSPEPRERFASVAEVRRALVAGPTRTAAEPPRSPRFASSPPSEPTEALMVPSQLRDLAKVPAPLSILVWMFAALASGFLLVTEIAILPVVFRIVMAVAGSEPRRRREVDVDHKRALASVRQHRLALGELAERTRPDPGRK